MKTSTANAPLAPQNAIDMVLGLANGDTILCLSAEIATMHASANAKRTKAMQTNLDYLAGEYEIAYLPVQGVYAGQTEKAFLVVAHTPRAAYAVAALALGNYDQESVLIAERDGDEGAIMARLIFALDDSATNVALGNLAIVDAWTARALYPDAHTIFPGTGTAMVCVPAA